MAGMGALDRDRLEAFSDGVLAVIITIMVLDLHPPAGGDVAALVHEVGPTFLAYVLSFVYVGIYWNNHHHLLRAADGIDGRSMWANLHLLFWLSLVPFTTAWLSGHGHEAVPTAIYGAVLLMAAFAYTLLTVSLAAVADCDSTLIKQRRAYDIKQISSIVLYLAGIALSFVAPWLGDACYVVVAFLWIVPDRRLERALKERERT